MRQGGERIGTSADLETVAEQSIRAGTRAPSPTVESRRNPGQVFQEPPSSVVGIAVKCGKILQTHSFLMAAHRHLPRLHQFLLCPFTCWRGAAVYGLRPLMAAPHFHDGTAARPMRPHMARFAAFALMGGRRHGEGQAKCAKRENSDHSARVDAATPTVRRMSVIDRPCVIVGIDYRHDFAGSLEPLVRAWLGYPLLGVCNDSQRVPCDLQIPRLASGNRRPTTKRAYLPALRP